MTLAPGNLALSFCLGEWPLFSAVYIKSDALSSRQRVKANMVYKVLKKKRETEGCVLCRFWALLMRLPHLLFLCNCLRAYWVKFWGYKQQSEPVKLCLFWCMLPCVC